MECGEGDVCGWCCWAVVGGWQGDLWFYCLVVFWVLVFGFVFVVCLCFVVCCLWLGVVVFVFDV